MNENEHKNVANNRRVEALKDRCNKYQNAYDTLLKLNKTLKDNNTILEKSFMEKTSHNSDMKENHYSRTMQEITEGVNVILKHHSNTQISHQEDTEKYNSGSFFTFYGTPETIGINDWFN